MINLVDQFGRPISAEESTSPTGARPTLTGYEGAMSTSVRDSFAAFPINSRRELNTYTRGEFVRKIRALDANLPIFGRIMRKIAQHSVGKGIFVCPLTQDKDWNTLNRKRFEAWSSNPWLYSIDNSRDLYEDQRLNVENMVGDGESLSLIVNRSDGLKMIQPLDVFECSSPRVWDPTKERWQDGVLTDDYDAPQFHGVRELPVVTGFSSLAALPANVRRVRSDSVLHLFRRRRAKQTRGLSWFYSGTNDGIDALDLKALIKGKAKLHSLLALAVRKKQGEAGTGLSQQLKKVLDADGNVTRVDENFWRGAAITYLAADEGIDLLSSDAPGENLMAFLEFLYSEIALATDLPVEVIRDLSKLGGTAVRSVNEAAQWLFDLVMDMVVMRHTRRIYVVNTADAMQRGELPMCKDPDWWTAAYRGPAKLNVDAGRTADAVVKLFKNCGLSHVRYHDERAQDAYQEATEEIAFLSWLKTTCEAAGVDYRDLIEPTPGAVNNISLHQSDPAS